HDLDEARRTILRRDQKADAEADRVVAEILAEVERRGDAALRDLTARYDGATLERFEVDEEEIAAARRQVPGEVVEALRLAIEQVRAFHARHLPRSWLDFGPDGAMGQLVSPIERIGVHAPGGRAAYPST